jgi:hypothetical protein
LVDTLYDPEEAIQKSATFVDYPPLDEGDCIGGG